MKKYAWDELYERAEGKGCGEPELRAKDRARHELGAVIYELEGIDIEACESAEEAINDFLESTDRQFLFDEDGHLLPNKSPYVPELKVWDVVEYDGHLAVVTAVDFTGKAVVSRGAGGCTKIHKSFLEKHVVGNISDCIGQQLKNILSLKHNEKHAALWKYDDELGIAYFCPECKTFVCASGECDCGTTVDLSLPAVAYDGEVHFSSPKKISRKEFNPIAVSAFKGVLQAEKELSWQQGYESAQADIRKALGVH